MIGIIRIVPESMEGSISSPEPMKLGPQRYVKASGPTSSFPCTAPKIVTTGQGLDP